MSGADLRSNDPFQRANQMAAAFPARRKRAVITGITGPDFSYLAERLLSENFEVHGIKRRSSSFNKERVDHLISDWHERDVRLFLHFGCLMRRYQLVQSALSHRAGRNLSLGCAEPRAGEFRRCGIHRRRPSAGNRALTERHSRNRNSHAFLQRSQQRNVRPRLRMPANRNHARQAVETGATEVVIGGRECATRDFIRVEDCTPCEESCNQKKTAFAQGV